MSILKKILVGIGAVVALIVLAALGLILNAQMKYDKTYDLPEAEVQISTDPKVLQRGKYLVYGPAHCVLCHISDAAENEKILKGQEVDLKGGYVFKMGPLGTLYSRNLTPDKETGLGRYSDGLAARMLRHNVRPNGKPSVGPMMPFGDLAQDDMNAILSYLKSRPAVKNPVQENQYSLLGKMVRTYSNLFKPRLDIHPPATAPAEAPTKERGEYLARYVANCVGCHTPRNPMTFVAIGPEFSGGMEMEPADLPGVDKTIWFRTPNLTPAQGSALSKFPDSDAFKARLRVGRQKAGSIMPWDQFKMMSDTDMKALYIFLSSLAPVEKPHIETEFKKT